MIQIILKDEHFFWLGVPPDELLFFENVYAFEHIDSVSLKITAQRDQLPQTEEKIKLSQTKNLYCVVDTPASNNFGHFFWESMVFLKSLKRLRAKFPSIVFLIKETKKFKKKFFEHYDLQFATTISNSDNYVGFLPLITSLVTNKYSTQYAKLIDQFHYELHSDSPSYFEKDTDIVFFPRHNSVDNYKYEGQDRSLDTSQLINFLNQNHQTSVFNTENSESWAEEFRAMQSSKFIICHDGSSGAVAAFCARGSIIINLSHNITLPSLRAYDKVRYIEEKSRMSNEKYYVTFPDRIVNVDLILPLLTRQITTH